MSISMVVVLAACVAAAAAYFGARLAERAGPVHAPEARSNHLAPTPSGGGYGMAAGVFLGLLAAAALGSEAASAPGLAQLSVLVVLAGVAAGVGALDDLFDLKATFKFLALWALSLLGAILVGAVSVLPIAGPAALTLPEWLAVAGSALWLFTAMNATNFMDGSDGLVGAALGAASAALAMAAIAVGAFEASLAAAVLAGACGGFLPVNGIRGRVFMGDVGSLFAGFWYAGASLLFITRAPLGALWIAPLLLLPILADALLTLGARARRRERLFAAHREHAYQLRIDRGASHMQVARTVGIRAGLLAGLALLSLAVLLATGEPAWPLAGFIAGVGLSVFWWRRDRRGLTGRRGRGKRD